ncbi:MAG TPA: hypothetical protein VGR81_14365 [Candidatus Acidoferrales bacterium]|nr:hypothetical protein [Candidatus Acidoferrales bacterium]
MYLCRNCQEPINSASAICPYCSAEQTEPEPAGSVKPAKKSSPAKLVISLAIVVAGIWAIIWFALPLRLQSPRPAAERAALQSLHALQQQLSTFENGANFYPSSLEALGEPVRDAAQQAMTGGYTLRYTPLQIGPNGNAHGYTLTAMPRNYGYRSFFTDQSGVIRSTRDNRLATAQDPPI